MATIADITEAIEVLKDLAENLPKAGGHTQSASTITEGIFAGQVVAHSSYQSPTAFLLRNSKLVEIPTNPTVNGEICWIYE